MMFVSQIYVAVVDDTVEACVVEAVVEVGHLGQRFDNSFDLNLVAVNNCYLEP